MLDGQKLPGKGTKKKRKKEAKNWILDHIRRAWHVTRFLCDLFHFSSLFRLFGLFFIYFYFNARALTAQEFWLLLLLICTVVRCPGKQEKEERGKARQKPGKSSGKAARLG